jgi:hypothetical protein
LALPSLLRHILRWRNLEEGIEVERSKAIWLLVRNQIEFPYWRGSLVATIMLRYPDKIALMVYIAYSLHFTERIFNRAVVLQPLLLEVHAKASSSLSLRVNTSRAFGDGA